MTMAGREHHLEIVPGGGRAEPRDAVGRSALLLRGAAWAAIAPVILLHVYYRDEGFDADAGMWAGVLGAFALVSLTYMRPRTMPVLQVMLVKLYLAAGGAVFQSTELIGARGRIHLSRDGLSTALFAICVLGGTCAASTLVGRGIGLRFRHAVMRWVEPTSVDSMADSAVVRVCVFVAVALHLAVAAAGAGQVLGSATHVITVLTAPSLTLTLLYWDALRRNTPIGRVLFVGATGAYVVAGLSSGMLGSAAEPIVVSALLLWSLGGQVPWRLLAVSFSVLIALNTAKHEYRAMTWNTERAMGIAERAELWLVALEKTYRGDASGAAGRSAESVAARVRILPQVAQVFDWVPGVVPHAGPGLWLTLPLELIPRVVWPAKPEHSLEYNLRYTLTFGIQHEKTRGRTSVALPPVADGYWRLGWLGVLVEGLLIGALVGFYASVFDERSRASVAIAVTFASGVSAEQHAMGTLSGQPQSIVGILAVVLALQLLAHMVRGEGDVSTPHSPD